MDSFQSLGTGQGRGRGVGGGQRGWAADKMVGRHDHARTPLKCWLQDNRPHPLCVILNSSQAKVKIVCSREYFCPDFSYTGTNMWTPRVHSWMSIIWSSHIPIAAAVAGWWEMHCSLHKMGGASTLSRIEKRHENHLTSHNALHGGSKGSTKKRRSKKIMIIT